MKIDRNITKQIEESKYLATENTWRYRTIVRSMYKNYEKMKYSMYKEDIFHFLKEYEEFNDYTMEMLKSDLDSLVNWRNLNATADTTKVNSIEEFKNREFRYNLSPVTIEIERMLIALEHMTIENTSSLESSLVERFRELIERLPKIITEEDKIIYDWFKELNSSFQDLNRNYQDYISKFYSPKNDELMKTTEFLIFKEGFIKYLREFIRTLQMNTLAIKEVLRDIENDTVETLIHKLFAYENKIKSIDLELDAKEYKDLNKGRIMSMKEWFISYNGRDPLVEQLINNTNEIIRRITRYAASIADKKSNNANRKEEYKKIAKFFSSCEEIEEAHRLSASIFGTLNVMKILANEERETESINSSIYEENPREFVISPKVRTYREKIIKNPILNKSERKEEKLQETLRKREKEQSIIFKYMNNNVIDFKELPEINKVERTLFLRLLTKGRSKKREWNNGDMGLNYKIELGSGENIVLKCEDGNLNMPPYKIIFKEVK